MLWLKPFRYDALVIESAHMQKMFLTQTLTEIFIEILIIIQNDFNLLIII